MDRSQQGARTSLRHLNAKRTAGPAGAPGPYGHHGSTRPIGTSGGRKADPGYDTSVRATVRVLISGVALLWWTAASGQTVTVVHMVNLRPDPSSEYASIRILAPSEPPLPLLEPGPESGYYHVRTGAGEEGYVWGRY